MTPDGIAALMTAVSALLTSCVGIVLALRSARRPGVPPTHDNDPINVKSGCRLDPQRRRIQLPPNPRFLHITTVNDLGEMPGGGRGVSACESLDVKMP